MTVDFDIKKIGEPDRRQAQKQRKAAQAAENRRQRPSDGEVIERRMHAGGVWATMSEGAWVVIRHEKASSVVSSSRPRRSMRKAAPRTRTSARPSTARPEVGQAVMGPRDCRSRASKKPRFDTYFSEGPAATATLACLGSGTGGRMRLTTIVLAGIAATTALAGSAMAQQGTHLSGSAALRGISPFLFDREEDAIRRSFQSVLQRDPTSSELRRYRNLMEEEHWSEADVRRDLSSRTDYRGTHEQAQHATGSHHPARLSRPGPRRLTREECAPTQHHRLQLVGAAGRKAMRNGPE